MGVVDEGQDHYRHERRTPCPRAHRAGDGMNDRIWLCETRC